MENEYEISCQKYRDLYIKLVAMKTQQEKDRKQVGNTVSSLLKF